MIYCENIVNEHFFFFTPQISEPLFFFPHFRQCHCHNCYNFFFPYFGNGIAAISLSQFFFFHFGYSTHTSHLGSRNWAKEFRYSHYRNSTFSLSPFFFFSLILFVEFWQWWYRNSLYFLTILNNFQQFL